MPLDLRALNRGFGECEVAFNGHQITIRYLADLKTRDMLDMKTVMVGVTAPDGTRFVDMEPFVLQLVRLLLPLDHEYGPGWDLVTDGEPVPITFENMIELPAGLPDAMLGAIWRDLQDPNRRKPSRRISSPRADSAPTLSPITGDSSRMPNGQESLPGPSPATPIPVVTGPVGESGSD